MKTTYSGMQYWVLGSLVALAIAAGSALILAPVHAQTSITLNPISKQLGVGSSGADVRTLQTLLATSQSAYPAGIVSGYHVDLVLQHVFDRCLRQYRSNEAGRLRRALKSS